MISIRIPRHVCVCATGPTGPGGATSITSSSDLLKTSIIEGCDKQIVIFEPLTPAANCDLILLALGNGSLQRNVPDGSVEGGDCRGDYAVDLQSRRDSPAQIASGISSVIAGGQQNSAKANLSVISGGAQNEASAYASSVSGGIRNIIDAPSPGGYIGGGLFNRIIGFASSIIGGFHNSIKANNSCILAGNFAVLEQSDTVLVPRLRIRGGIQKQVRIVRNDTQLTLDDHIIVVKGASQISLPSNPVIGQKYTIINWLNKEKIKVGDRIISPKQKLKLLWDGEEWLNFINR